MSQEINDTSAALKALVENRSMQGEISSWVIDLSFCSRMLQIYGLKADDDEIKGLISRNQSIVERFIQDRLSKLTSDLKISEQQLIRLSEDTILIKDRDMPYRQKADVDEVESTRKAFKELRESLYSLIDELKSL